MGSSSTMYAAFAALFVTTILIVRIKADANHSESKTTSISPPSQTISPTSSTIVDIEPLPVKAFSQRIISILSPEIFLEPDPLWYMLDKVTKNSSQQFPRPYVPYAKLLSSLVVCLIRLQKASTNVGEIHQKYSAQSADYPPAPSDISTPELRALFSADIFSDTEIPSVLLWELLQIPEDRIKNARDDLVKVLKNRNYAGHVYNEYMTSLRLFLQNGSCLARLRHANAFVQRPISN
ncbi:hypothetical protein U1Q18_044367 [Sarracenia purpurea var. burkii]